MKTSVTAEQKQDCTTVDTDNMTICHLWFSTPDIINFLVYGDGSVRTYYPGSIDGRLGREMVLCNDLKALVAHCRSGKGSFIVPVTVARQFAESGTVFADPT